MSEKYLAAIHLSAPLRKSFEYEYNEVTDSVMRRIENSLTKLHFNFKVRSFASVSQFLSLSAFLITCSAIIARHYLFVGQDPRWGSRSKFPPSDVCTSGFCRLIAN